MTQQIINIGAAPNDGTGDPARTAFDKSNQNFTELYQVSRPTGNAIEFQFNNTITEPPAVGQLRFNQATQASTTKIWVSHTTSSGVNIKQFLAAATTGAKLVLQDKIDNTNYIKFDVTGAPVDKTTYWEFAVAVTASGGNLPNAAILAAVTAATGGFITQVVMQKFTASGTYTPSAGMKHCIIECIGGGGAGGGVTGATGNFYAAGGGGSGGYSRKYATAAAVGASQVVTVGAAGVPNGGSGGNTGVGVLCTAAAGVGGGNATSAIQPVGGSGGNAASGTGDIVVGGAPGGSGMFNNLNNSIISCANFGGSSAFGGGGRGLFGSSDAAQNYGSGGGGGSLNVAGASAGAAGSSGVVIITEFI